MSGFERHSNRAAARVAFNKFSEAFRREKSYQQLILSESKEYQEALAKTKDKILDVRISAAKEVERLQNELLSGQPLLGKKPPFGTWMKAVKRATLLQQQKMIENLAKENLAESVPDGEWNDDGTLATPSPDAIPQVELKVES